MHKVNDSKAHYVKKPSPEKTKTLWRKENSPRADHTTTAVTNVVNAIGYPDLRSEDIQRIQSAIQGNRIFSIYGHYPTISEELKKRYWVEKKDPELHPLSGYFNITLSLTTLAREYVENEYVWSAVKNIRPNYVFTTSRKYIYQNINDATVLSYLDDLNFSNKVELVENVKTKSKNINVKFPRSYIVTNNRARDIFLKDYRFTAILCSLKFILRSNNSRTTMFNENGTIPYEMIDFILRHCYEFLKAYQTKKVINDVLWFTTAQFDYHWNKFMDWFYELVEESGTIRLHSLFQINDIYEQFNSLACKLQTFCPQFFIDGDTNLWIVKPTNSCSGLGIQIERNLNKILEIIRQPKRTYLIQKYIEKPLKICNVKVDLRQYFLITNGQPLKIWMYKEGYVRFCSKKFSLRDLSEAVHLSNVRVQSHYRKIRSSGVPEECMWDFERFKQYLISLNKGDKWNTLIYPSICKTISTIVYGNYHKSIRNKCSFQLFGADFVLTENFEPWLIEINDKPGLNPTTSIISRIVMMLLRDIIKVTVDFPLNSNTDTGLFENIYTDKFVKDNAKKSYTKEYYYWQAPKNIKQLNIQSHKGIKKN